MSRMQSRVDRISRYGMFVPVAGGNAREASYLRAPCIRLTRPDRTSRDLACSLYRRPEWDHATSAGRIAQCWQDCSIGRIGCAANGVARPTALPAACSVFRRRSRRTQRVIPAFAAGRMYRATAPVCLPHGRDAAPRFSSDVRRPDLHTPATRPVIRRLKQTFTLDLTPVAHRRPASRPGMYRTFTPLSILTRDAYVVNEWHVRRSSALGC